MGIEEIDLYDIYKKYPFLYEVNGRFYFIGWGICKMCKESSAVVHYFKEYKKMLDLIGTDVIASKTREIETDLLDTLLYYFRKVKAYSDVETDEADALVFKKQIEDFLDSQSDEKKNEIHKQLFDFVNVFHYYYQHF